MTEKSTRDRMNDLLKQASKKDCVPYGSDVSAGTYECADCGYIYSNQSKTSLQPCPKFTKDSHPKKCWKILSGKGDDPKDPYPNKKS